MDDDLDRTADELAERADHLGETIEEAKNAAAHAEKDADFPPAGLDADPESGPAPEGGPPGTSADDR